MGNPNMKKGAPSLNPSGRPPKTEAVREAEEALAKLSPAAVAKLEELMQTADEKIQAMVALGIVKATIGELSRVIADVAVAKDATPLTGEERRAYLAERKAVRESLANALAVK